MRRLQLVDRRHRQLAPCGSDGRRILFLSIFDHTVLFHALAERLAAGGHRVYWVTTDAKWTLWLRTHGVARDDIQELVYDTDGRCTSGAGNALLQEIVACERGCELTMNQVLAMDRFVRGLSEEQANEWVYRYYRDIKKFLVQKEIDVVFGEPTNANELITSMICRELDIPFLTPRDMRFPLGRLIFTRGHLPHRLVGGCGCGAPDEVSRLLGEFAARRTTPYYFDRLKRGGVIGWRRARKALRNRTARLISAQPHGLAYHRLPDRLRTTFRRLLNGFYLRRIVRYDSLGDVANRIAFFPLHVQPEASIDVCGSYVSDQLKLIRDMRRALPFDMTLVIKEHPNFLGLKSRSFFRQIRKIPNVRLISHEVSNFDVYRRASLVLTVSGTPAYEAAMLGIPAVTMAPMFFGEFSMIRHCVNVAELKPIVTELLTCRGRNYFHDCKVMTRLLEQSYPGYWTDPVFDSSVLKESNLAELTKAFQDVIARACVKEDAVAQVRRELSLA